MKKAIMLGAVIFALFALAGCPNGENDPDLTPVPVPTPTPTPEPVLKLTVTGIPDDTTIFSAALFGADFISAGPLAIPVAVGMNNGGTFSFNTSELGKYYIKLSSTMDGTPPNYVYMADTVPALYPARYDFQNLDGNTVAWTRFVAR
jgi:hypothetical protein